MLKDIAADVLIEGGGLKRWVETRWHTIYDCTISILKHKIPLETVSIYLIQIL